MLKYYISFVQEIISFILNYAETVNLTPIHNYTCLNNRRCTVLYFENISDLPMQRSLSKIAVL